VEVFCRPRGDQLELHVADSGVGIAEDQLERVFDEFYRIGTERAEGLGLGLAIVKKTAELLNHKVVARSRVGVGSVFSVRLPIAELHQIGQFLPAPEELPDSQLVGAFIVVVDDDEEIRIATEAIFKSWHCHVISGASGRSVQDALSEHLRQPDLIVADLRLSAEETGLDVVHMLRTDAELPVPAIILSADQDSAMVEKVRSQGMVFLQKPVNPYRLRRTAIELLRQSYLMEHQVVSPR
jgi:CheY-like chemotaxis protein